MGSTLLSDRSSVIPDHKEIQVTNTVICQACSVSIYYCLVIGQVYFGTIVAAKGMVPVVDDILQLKKRGDTACPCCEEAL